MIFPTRKHQNPCLHQRCLHQQHQQYEQGDKINNMNKVIRSVTQVLPRKYPQSSDETHQYRFDHQQRNKIQVKNKQQCIENVCTSIYLIFSESKHRKCMMAEQETTNPSKNDLFSGTNHP